MADSTTLSAPQIGPSTAAELNATAAPTTGTATLPDGTTIAPNQANTGTVTAPNIITTSAASRNTTNQSSSALNSALAQFGITAPTPAGTPANPTTSTSTSSANTQPDTGPTASGVTVNPDGSTNSGTSTDPYITSLNNIATAGNTSTKLLVNSILNTKNNNTNATNTQYAAYKKGLQLLGIQHNSAQSTPDLLASQINQAEDQHQQKLQTIQAAMAKSLSDAQTAQDNNDFKTLTDQMTYYKGLQTDQANELKAYQTSLINQPKVAASVADSVYSTMQTLDPADQETFLQAVAQQYNLPLGSLVNALTAIPAAQATTAAKAATATANATIATDKAANGGTLSVTDAKSLGLPYGTTVAAAQKMGIVPTTKSTSKSTATISKETIAAGEQALDATKGTDKYVDPYAYQALYNSYTKAGGTTASFLTAYPPKDYVNPAATNLPSYLMPVKTTSSRSS